VVRGGKLVYFIPDTVAYPERPLFYHTLDPKVFVLKLIPGIDPAILTYLKDRYDAVILESFGVGGVPSYNGDSAFTDAIHDWISSGKTVIITTQVPYEGSDMGVYEVGHSIKNEYGVLENYDMPLEAVVTKIMWILGQTKDPELVRYIFYTPVQKDIILS
jgi:L-asparaginase